MKIIFEDNFDFTGTWGIPSRCKLKVIDSNNLFYVIATELYKDNPGSTITDVTASLATQICDHFMIPKEKLVYIEHNPETKTKLSFYEEEFFKVSFLFDDQGNFISPSFQKIDKQTIPE